jgi:hypothetical protein
VSRQNFSSVTGSTFTRNARRSDGGALASGEYYFYSADQKDHHPVCSETWRFGDDGKLTVYSGQEIVTETFRIEMNHVPLRQYESQWLVLKFTGTNGLADCRGKADPNPTASELRYAIYLAATGDFVIGFQLPQLMRMPGNNLVHPLRLMGYLHPARREEPMEPARAKTGAP